MSNYGFLIEGRNLSAVDKQLPIQWARGNGSNHKLESHMTGPRCILDERLDFYADLWKIVYSTDILEPIGAIGQPGVTLQETETHGVMSVIFTNLGTNILLAPKGISLTELRNQFGIGRDNFDGVSIFPIIF